MLKLELLALMMLVLIAPIGCQQPETTTPIVKKEPAPIKQTLTAGEIDRYLDGEMSLEPSSDRIISGGDLRPEWIVMGRIRNACSCDIRNVKVRLIAYDRDETRDTVLDTAEFEVKDIPAHEAKAFRREVQLMVSPGKFRFNYEFLNATMSGAN